MWSAITAVVLEEGGEPTEVALTSARRGKNWNLLPTEQNYRTEAMTVQQDVRWNKIKKFGLHMKSVGGSNVDKSHSSAEVATDLSTFRKVPLVRSDTALTGGMVCWCVQPIAHLQLLRTDHSTEKVCSIAVRTGGGHL
jgi:hypothetical protein